MAGSDLSSSINVTLSLSLDTVVGEHVEHDNEGEPIGRGGVTLGSMVAEVIASRMIDEAKRDVKRIDTSERINRAIDEAVKEKLSDILEREIVPTDQYGNRKGQSTTLAEAITEHATKWLGEQVGDYNKRQSRIGKLVNDEVGRRLESEVAAAIKAGKAEAMAKVQSIAAEAFSKQLERWS